MGSNHIQKRSRYDANLMYSVLCNFNTGGTFPPEEYKLQNRFRKNLTFNVLGSYHKRQISNPPTPLPPMFKTAKSQIHYRRYQPNLTLDFGGYDHWRLWILAGTGLTVLKFGVCGCRPNALRGKLRRKC